MRSSKLVFWTVGMLLSLALHLGLAPFGIPPAFAQQPAKGTITGRVLDAETQEPLLFANVILYRVTPGNPDGEPAGGAMGTAEGTYSLKVAPGTYNIVFSYISYEKATVTNVVVTAGETVTLDGLLTTGAIQIETVEVIGEVVETASGSMLTKLRNEAAVADAITADQISRTTDGDAAEALQRVTGVSVVGGRYVYVRGLGERYSATQVNGASVGTPEANKRVVPLDIFPTGVLDNVVVQKTYTPDMEGEFGGSVIDINTRDFVDSEAFKQSLSVGYGQDVTGNKFLSYQGGDYDFLGFDDGTRALPGLVKDMAGDKRVTTRNFSAAELAAMGNAFSNTWSPKFGEAKPNIGYSGSYAKGFKLFGREAGTLLSLTYGRGYRNLDKEDNVYLGSTAQSIKYEYDVTESSAGMRGGVTGGFNLRLNDDDKVRANLLYTRTATDQTRIAEGYNDDRGRYIRNTQLSYVEQGLFSGVLSGTHGTGVLNSRLDWNAAYSEAARNEPDRRTSTYERSNPDDDYKLGGISNYPLQRIFGESHDYDRSLKLDWTVPFTGWAEGESKVKVGTSYRTKDRDSEFRRFGFRRVAREPVDLTRSPELLLGDENSDGDHFRLEELTQANDAWVADQTVKGAYAMVDLPLADGVRLTTGARYETSEQSVLAQSNYATTAAPIHVSHEDDDLLPSVNMTLNPRGDMNVRLAYAQTVNRPELRELSPFTMFNFETGYSETGDTSLVTARLDHYDLRWEYYPSPGEFVSLGFFYKKFDRPIQKFVFPDVGGYALKPVNGETAELRGWEAEIRLSFVNVWKALDWTVDLGEVPESMLRWSLVANYSRVHSSARLPDAQGEIVETPFAGQSPYSTNLGLFYASKSRRFDASLLYKSFGKRLDAFGFARIPDIYEHPPETLDFSMTYGLSGDARLKFSAENMLNQATEYHQGRKITQRYRAGVRFGLAVSYQPTGPSDDEE